MTITFEELADDHGLRVQDAAEGEQVTLRTDRAVDPEPASPDEFVMPVGNAVVIEAGELHLEVFETAEFLEAGEVVHRTHDRDSVELLDRGTYEVDVSPPAAKTYVKVCDAAVAARYTDDHLYLDVEPATRLVVGVRSHHERPAATVTTTDDPRDLMRAVSTFGSTLETHTPDRSWPTLRGHPPAVERGDGLDVPDAVAPPDTGVTIEVPPEYDAIYAVASLAAYLGATVEPGRNPRLHAAGCTREFDTENLAADVASCLEHVFTLDGVVRTVGVYPFRHEQADGLEERVDLDYDHLFDLPLDERTAAYLDVPQSATEGLLAWHVTADVAPEPGYAPVLPYVVNELAHVRSPPERAERAVRSPNPDALARSEAHSASTSPPASVVVPEDAGTPGHVWAADGFAVGAANPTVGAYQRSFDWPSGTDPLDVHVVYNDERIDDPEDARYDVHPTAETDVRVSHSLSTGQLREALREDTDFLHFVGHVTDSGMACPDGELDVRTLVKTGVGAFFLNGCHSYEQGYALLTAGSAGGIVTVDDVEDENASRIGSNAAMLLDNGYPLYGVLDVLGRAGLDTSRYTILGDATLALRKNPSGSSHFLSFDSDALAPHPDPVPVKSRRYPFGENGLGALSSANYSDVAPQLTSARERREFVPRDELARALDTETSPVSLDAGLYRFDELSMADFR